MSLVIAIKDNNKITIGADSQVSDTANGTKSIGSKIYTLENGVVLGTVGKARLGQLLGTNPNVFDELTLIKKGLTIEYVSNALYDNVLKLFKEKTILEKDTYPDITFIVSYKDKVFAVNDDGFTEEIKDSYAIGSGREVAMGVLEATKDEKPEIRIIKAIEAASKNTLYVNGDIEIVNV